MAFEPTGSPQPREGGEGGSGRSLLGLGEACGGPVSQEMRGNDAGEDGG